MHFLGSGPSLFAFLSHIFGNFTAALRWLVQVFPLIKEIWLPNHKGLILCISLPEVSRWYFSKNRSGRPEIHEATLSKPKPPTGRRPGGSVNARWCNHSLFFCDQSHQEQRNESPSAVAFLWGVYWLSVYKHCRVANFHVFIWCESGWGEGGGVVFAPASSYTADLNVIKKS